MLWFIINKYIIMTLNETWFNKQVKSLWLKKYLCGDERLDFNYGLYGKVYKHEKLPKIYK